MSLVEQDVQAMLRLVVEVTRLQAMSVERHHRALRGLCELTGSPLAFNLRVSSVNRVLRVTAGCAWGQAGLHRFEGTDGNPVSPGAVLLRGLAPIMAGLQASMGPGPHATVGNAVANTVGTAAPASVCVCSLRKPLSGPALHVLAVSRPEGPAFGPREERIVRLLHEQVDELCPLGAGASQPALGQLPPYLQRLVPELLAGAGEKQIAAKLGFTFNTTHQYIKAIYRRLGVSSRAEFMARYMADLEARNAPRGPGAGAESAAPKPTAA